MLARTAADAVGDEVEMQQALLARFGVDPRDADEVALSPSGLLYVNTMLGYAARGPLEPALASVLACAWIYWEMGQDLLRRGSPDPRYQAWLAAYADPDYAAAVQALLDLADRVGARAGERERQRMVDIFVEGARLEWLFWDAAWRQETWPV